MKRALIPFEGKHIITTFVYNHFSECCLTAHCVYGHNIVGEFQSVQ